MLHRLLKWRNERSAELRGDLPGRFRERASDPSEWSTLFGVAQHEQVTSVLEDVCDAFSVAKLHAFRLRPRDRIIDIYRARYCELDLSDAFEMETLADIVERKYRRTIAGQVWQTLTLGDLTAIVINGPITAIGTTHSDDRY